MPSVLTESRRRGSRFLGVLLIILGAIALLAPFYAALFVIRGLMWLLVFAAVEQVIYAFQTRDEGGLFLKLSLGGLYAVAAGLLLGRPFGGAIAVTAIIGFLLIADGLAEIALGVELRHTYDPKIGWLIGGGILSVVLGGFILLRLPRSMLAVGIVLGIRLVFKGIEHIVRSSMTKPERIEERRAA